MDGGCSAGENKLAGASLLCGTWRSKRGEGGCYFHTEIMTSFIMTREWAGETSRQTESVWLHTANGAFVALLRPPRWPDALFLEELFSFSFSFSPS